MCNLFTSAARAPLTIVRHYTSKVISSSSASRLPSDSHPPQLDHFPPLLRFDMFKQNQPLHPAFIKLAEKYPQNAHKRL